ncbi:MAG TPA: lamin tail domain-containing protein [Gaiellaceae bacterium]|nr:lamin tail domain-containing protein [Gaiellaceae bacterium]
MNVRARGRAPLVVAAVGVLVLAGLAGGTSSAGVARDTPAAAHLVLNEVDYDNVGTDTQEFVEIFNGTGAGVPLADFAVVLVNGGTNLEYSRTMLAAAGTCLPARGYLVIADDAVVPEPHALVIRFPGAHDQIQNGQPDGVALIDTGTQTLVDALSYEGSITMAQIDGFPGPVSLVEGLPTPLSDSNTLQVSLAREPNGADTDKSANDWALAGPTPGFANSPSISSGTGLHGTCGRTPPPPAFR